MNSAALVSSPSRRTLPSWEHAKKHPRSISGVKLEGTKPVLEVYIDESGISDKEPIAIAAGVIVNDKQLLLVEHYIESLVIEYVPVEKQNGFIFHATELFHKSSDVPPDRSHEALHRLLAIPSIFHLTIVFGYARKLSLPSMIPEAISPRKRQKLQREMARKSEQLYHSLAFCECAIGVESFMQRDVPKEEVAKLISEINRNTRNAVKNSYDALKGKVTTGDQRTMFHWLNQLHPGYLPLTKIRHVPLFAQKDEVSILQLADACAMVIRRCAESRADIEPFIRTLSINEPDKLRIGGKLTDNEYYGGFNILTFSPQS